MSKKKPEITEPEVKEHLPTPEEAKQMFEENPGLSYVVTTEGGKVRGEA